MIYQKKIFRNISQISFISAFTLISFIITSCDFDKPIPSNNGSDKKAVYDNNKLYAAIGFNPNTSHLTGKNVQIAILEGDARYIIDDDVTYMQFKNRSLGVFEGKLYLLKEARERFFHATAVASVLASKNIGIARGITFYPMSTAAHTIADVYSTIKGYNILAINNSWGSHAKWSHAITFIKNDTQYWDKEWIDSVGRKLNWPRSEKKRKLDAFANDMENNKDRAPLWVWAAGNVTYGRPWGRLDDVRYSAGLPYYIKSLEKYWIAVAGVRFNGSYSSLFPCSRMKTWCLAAPAINVNIQSGGKKDVKTGTSFAAPQVTAALALLQEKCPSSSQFEIRDILLRTARHETANGYRLKAKDGSVVKTTQIAVTTANGTQEERALSYEYGHGILRLDLALKQPCR